MWWNTGRESYIPLIHTMKYKTTDFRMWSQRTRQVYLLQQLLEVHDVR